MTNDIVERLRRFQAEAHHTDALPTEAADEITKLREEVVRLNKDNCWLVGEAGKANKSAATAQLEIKELHELLTRSHNWDKENNVYGDAPSGDYNRIEKALSKTYDDKDGHSPDLAALRSYVAGEMRNLYRGTHISHWATKMADRYERGKV